MAKMVKEVYGHKDGKTVLLKVGDEAPKELADKLVAKGYAKEDEKPKQQPAKSDKK